MNMPYRTSRDYQLLKSYWMKERDRMFTDFPIDNRISAML